MTLSLLSNQITNYFYRWRNLNTRFFLNFKFTKKWAWPWVPDDDEIWECFICRLIYMYINNCHSLDTHCANSSQILLWIYLATVADMIFVQLPITQKKSTKIYLRMPKSSFLRNWLSDQYCSLTSLQIER